MLKKIVLVAGARPNFMKIAPIIDALENDSEAKAKFVYALVHTGQHYDEKMSEQFFVQLSIPKPTINLEAGGGTQAEQTGSIMIRFEKYLLANPCDLVIVVGDVTSTLACTIVAKKLQIPVAHVEGGIRSRDMSMPEEINRIVTDSLADYFFTTSKGANENLIGEGKRPDQLFFVGNTMIDTLLKHQTNFRKPSFWDTLSLSEGTYVVLTLHRPSNVDDSVQLQKILQAIERGAETLKVIFPIHPRTRNNFERFQLSVSNLMLVEPLGYLEFNYLVKHAKGVITDSGGITEETTVLGVPCVTLRTTTERPETCDVGTNELIGVNPDTIELWVRKMKEGNWKKGSIPELWDGSASRRIVKSLLEILD